MRSALTWVALATSAVAQLRLLDPSDLTGRAACASELQSLLAARADLPTTVALAACAGQQLPTGSAARQQLDQALSAANREPEPPRAIGQLRMQLHELLEILTFAPLLQAESPAGFPEFRAVNEIELRHYPRYRMVQTAMRGGSMAAFWPLFRHIESNHIAMTTPVQMDWQEQADAVDRPVRMAFLYGDPDRSPGRADRGVEVVDVPAQWVLSVGAIGDDQRQVVEALHRRLLACAAANATRLAPAGPPRTMGYNSPMVSRERRYFEVQLPVRLLPGPTQNSI